MKTIYYVFKLTFTISRSRSCSKIKRILKNKNKFKVKKVKRTAWDSNPEWTALKSSTLTITSQKTSYFVEHY